MVKDTTNEKNMYIKKIRKKWNYHFFLPINEKLNGIFLKSFT